MADIFPMQNTLSVVQPKAVALTTPAGRQNALKAVTVVVAAYRQSFDDLETFMRLAAEAVEDYPEAVLADLASPKLGIIRESKWAPSVAELVAWCERRRAEKIEAAAETPEERLAIYHAAQRGEEWARAYFKIKGIAI